MKAVAFSILSTLLFLTGCQKNPDIDALKNDAASAKQQIVALKSDADQQKQRIAELTAQVTAMNEKLVELTAKATKTPVTNGPPPRPGGNQIAGLEKAVSQCVQTVRAMADTAASGMGEVYTKFDAYYNPGMNWVVNNNQYVDQSAVYAFNKCMAKQGWPLS